MCVFLIITPYLTLCVKIKYNAPYFALSQSVLLGQCLDGAPVAFLQNFNVKCVTLLRSCPTGYPLLTVPNDLTIQVKNGQGGMFYLPIKNCLEMFASYLVFFF